MADDYDVFGSLSTINNADIRKKVAQSLAATEIDLPSDHSEDNDLSLLEGFGSARKKLSSPLKELVVPKQLQSSPKKAANKRKSKAPQTKQNEFHNHVTETALSVAATTQRRRSLRNRQEAAALIEQSRPTPSAPKRRAGRKKRQTEAEATTAPVAPATTVALEADDTVSASAMDVVNVFEMLMEASNRSSRRSVMRARRNYLAELAARAQIVDHVDLVSSPVPRIEGVVVVDSDNEDSHSNDAVVESNSNPLDCSFDEENPEISVKVKWNGANAEVFLLRKHQKFVHIFQQLAERENTTMEHVMLNIENRIISPTDTPHSIDYKIYEFICGRVLTEVITTAPKKRDTNKITLKVQSDLWPKRPLKVELFKTDTFKVLYIKCGEELSLPYDTLKLSFDGEELELNATPTDLEFEGGEAIDLRIKK